MISADVIVVGAGPAGSTCASVLQRAGMSVIVLDRAAFPRLKPCAGWINPVVFRSLELPPEDYPLSLTRLKVLHYHLRGIPLPVPTRQFAVRRIEFDDWLLSRASLPVYRHTVRHIRRDGDRYVIDDSYSARWIVGAGGTGCPVYRTFFRTLRPRRTDRQIISLELEFPTRIRHTACHLWFFSHGLPGYSWYVPKVDGWLNIGVGAVVATLKQRRQRIRDHWDRLVRHCQRKGWLDSLPAAPIGYSYSLRLEGPLRTDRVLIAGDAAGMATLDMGEGIGPAMESGRCIAQAILEDTAPDVSGISQWSLGGILFPFRS